MKRNRHQFLLSQYHHNHAVQLVHGGKTYFDKLIAMIDGASNCIHLQTYIYENDATGQQVTQALIAAAGRGVAIYVLLDSYGSEGWKQSWPSALEEAGVHFRWFSSVANNQHFYLGRRLHHKVVVADAQRCLVGGVNISNRYNDLPNDPAWLDWALYCEGPAAAILDVVCLRIWQRDVSRKKRLTAQQFDCDTSLHNCMPVRVRRNDWVRGHVQITRSYLEMFREAQSHIIMMSSYFLPGRKMRKAMQQAANRGVKVCVITAGKSDVKTAKYAERYLYNWMLRHNMQVYEYMPHILHGKLSTYDGKWVTVGSFNVNNISTFASVELNMDVLNDRFAQDVEVQLKYIMQHQCTLVDNDSFTRQTKWYHRLWYRINYDFIRITFFLFTFYFKQEKRQR